MRILIALMMVVTLTGCGHDYLGRVEDIPSGSTFTTRSGLTFTVPPGTHATVTTPKGIRPEQNFASEVVEIVLDDSSRVTLYSHSSARPRAQSTFTQLAISDDDSVAVFDPDSPTMAVMVDTDARDNGRITVEVPRGWDGVRGLALAHEVWNRLGIRGAVLPALP